MRSFQNPRHQRALGRAVCLFASRDVWFVVALPVFFYDQHGWSHWTVGGLLAAWIIGYGGVQTQAQLQPVKGDARTITAGWAAALAVLIFCLRYFPWRRWAGWWWACWRLACCLP